MKPTIKRWDLLPDWAKFIAIDPDGCVVASDHKPTNKGHYPCWGYDINGNIEDIPEWTFPLVGFDRGDCDWREAIIERPE